jgi:hypothetical protein
MTRRDDRRAGRGRGACGSPASTRTALAGAGGLAGSGPHAAGRESLSGATAPDGQRVDGDRADRAVRLPPVTEEQARRMIGGLRAGRLLAGFRGAAPADTAAVIRAITGLSALAMDLGDELAALDVNPLICGPAGAVAVDALAVSRRPQDRG